MNTWGMKNVENAFTKRRGSHPEASPDAATTTGTTSKETPSTASAGIQTHQEKFGDQYKQPGILGKMFSKAVSGSKTGPNRQS